MPKSRTSKSPTSRIRLKTNYKRYRIEKSILDNYQLRQRFIPKSKQVREQRRRR